MRLLFILYAEDRNLFDKSIPKTIKGEKGILSKITEAGKGIGELDTDVTPDFDDDTAIKRLFELIDDKYNGGLFSGMKHQLLHSVNINDVLFLNALDHLCRVQIGKKIYTVDFSEISARELGSIYESLLEYKLAEIEEDKKDFPSIINKRIIRKNVKKGDLYLISQKGERKSSGSYYTNDLIVDHLVHNVLDQRLKTILDEIIESKGNFHDLLIKVLDIKICDPAMGSGHFLLGAYSRLIAFLQESLEILREEGLETRFVWDEQTAFTVRSHVAIRCIYGVDLNEIAVEIAKLVLWMKVFRSDKPFEFYDSNLVCGNSLIGISEELSEDINTNQISFWETTKRMEERIQKTLLENVEKMMGMPRNNRAEIDAVNQFHQTKIVPLQKQIDFMLNMELAEYLTPDQKEIVENGIRSLVEGIDTDSEYVSKILAGDPEIPESVKSLKTINEEIISLYNPLHWRNAFPHIAVRGGFDIILSNPPWDIVKPFWRWFLTDYASDFPDLVYSKDEKNAKKKAFSKYPELEEVWKQYENSILKQNNLYRNLYEYQSFSDKKGNKKLKGDNNLYKLFVEKIYNLLRKEGTAGLVIPDNFNLDAGTTGIRKLILDHTKIAELIMFENKLKVFKDVHSQYKFNLITFEKSNPRANGTFSAEFYWYDPIWLDHVPTKEYIDQNEKSIKSNHRKFKYPLSYIKDSDSEKYTIREFRNPKHINIFKKLTEFPALGDKTQNLYIETYSEFHMTNDKNMFSINDIGWPLFEGKMIEQFNCSFLPANYYVDMEKGEDILLSRKAVWKKRFKETGKLNSRVFRIAWRDITNATNARGMIATVLPRGVFTGNTLNLMDLYYQGNLSDDKYILAGLVSILNSMTLDFYLRQRISLHASAGFVKELPVPRDIESLKKLGEMALPLFSEDKLSKFRGEDIKPLTDLSQRDRLRAKLDASVARIYGLNLNEYKTVLEMFPIVNKEYKDMCVKEFNELLFDSDF